MVGSVGSRADMTQIKVENIRSENLGSDSKNKVSKTD